jgi:putative phosphoesterase
MQIGILSDTHNQTSTLQTALNYFKQRKINTLMHCGDMTTVETAQYLCEFHLYYVFGNGDFLSGEIRATLKGFDSNNFGALSYSGEISGKQIGAIHGHLPAELDLMIRNQKYDYLFTGHTHRRKDEKMGKTRVINPGALGGTRYQSRSVAVLNLTTGALHFQEIET